MHDAIVQVPDPVNEPIYSYAKGSPEKARLKAALADIEREVVEIPCVVGGQRVTTGRIREVVMPHRHRHVVARYHAAEPDTAERAIRAALDARREWAAMRWESRAAPRSAGSGRPARCRPPPALARSQVRGQGGRVDRRILGEGATRRPLDHACRSG